MDIFPQVKAFACKLLRGYLYCPTYIVLHIPKDLACAVAFDAKFVMKTESSTKLGVLG